MGVVFGFVSLLLMSFAADGERIDPRRVSDEERVQWELPAWDGVSRDAGRASVPGGGTAREWDRGGRADRPPSPPSAAGSFLVKLLQNRIVLGMILLLGFGVLVLAVVGLLQGLGSRGIESRTPRSGSSGQHPADLSASSVSPPSLEEVEALAAAGRYADAIHLLLLRSLIHLQQEGRRKWPRAYTSREILARGRLHDELREPLRVLVESVERSRFGARPLGAGDYSTCRESAERVAAWSEPSA